VTIRTIRRWKKNGPWRRPKTIKDSGGGGGDKEQQRKPLFQKKNQNGSGTASYAYKDQ
jgi:hypothetical protein